MTKDTDRRWGVTRSGYQYERIKAAELVPEEGQGDFFAWSCGEKNCGGHIQGGRAALMQHRHVVHPEIYGPPPSGA